MKEKWGMGRETGDLECEKRERERARERGRGRERSRKTQKSSGITLI